MKSRITALILAALMLTASLVSCRTDDKPDEGSQPPETDTTEVTTEENKEIRTKLVDENGKLKYNLIRYPAEPDENTMSAITKLRDKIKTYTGTAPQLQAVYPSTAKPLNAGVCEILIGELGYEECNTALAGTHYGDYTITTVGNKIVIGAYSSDEISRAINYVTGTMLNEKDEDGNRLLEIYEYSYRSTKSITSIDINGNDLSEYSIAYGTKGNDDEYNYAAAMKLRDQFSRKAGYLLPVIKDVDSCSTPRRLLVGTGFVNMTDPAIPTPAAMNYECKTVGNDYIIACGGNYTADKAVSDFIIKYLNKPAENGKVSIADYSGSYLKITEAPRADGTELRVMTYNILANYWTDYIATDLRYEPLKGVIDVYDPDIIGLQEVCAQWSNKIYSKLSDTYAFVNQKTPDGKFVNLSAIIYKKDKFEVVETGLEYLTPQGPNHIRLVNWAIFKDKATGKLFAFFNTHWDPASGPHGADHAKILNKVMADHPDVKYAFSTGDYNAKPGTEAYTTFLQNTGLLNASDVAKAAGTLKNDAGGCAVVGKNKESLTTSGPIDHIIITNNIDVLAFETILWNGVEHVSDHSPKYADIKLK